MNLIGQLHTTYPTSAGVGLMPPLLVRQRHHDGKKPSTYSIVKTFVNYTIYGI